ncbi:MAG: peptidase T [Flavobacteriia bacterium]|nr:peptidase T [Flavobacteriia bacterium]OIP45120.1 MAG: peptidase T [Flavobacteriaceae bacterium CG2_30_31_66]PIV95316.1 MAG: peptidase T [Flavobacteriaceae bacterium CG17_big_fil_post_rev_8_21_14_2_50_31_13]PIY13647.1 MAG: peptidase T [Flavobacteriaceae bacterium CG_4_10_14_3_um_filter_31_253]PIZ11792.1 MAG: peptidase T [Flavobacteriaceae bacterium CG_4_10_14_0_8_um_filter_31_99]PJC09013.1 MAG: peptidase T [Flavobacteriaceae bacterium CG_4_9_14_0_8_um_filter_31_91]
MINKQLITNRFLKYVVIDTTSDPENPAFPSTEKQWNLAKLLKNELLEIGLEDVYLDENCYLMATLPSNLSFQVPTIGFISHIDTSPDFSGTNVHPKIIENYQGNDIILNETEKIKLSSDYFEEIKQYIGKTIITTDGTTLLGADDKAGVTEIVTAIEYLVNHPEIKHGKIRICFTPDEEVGKGAHLFNVEKFDAEWAYTMDGSQIGELEYENFNAASAKIIIKGKSVHPGYAKGKMINSILIANDFISSLPTNEVPEKTTGYEGFFHLHDIKGDIEETVLEYIIRDHDFDKFEERKYLLQKIAFDINQKYENDCVFVTLKNQYFNMKKMISPVMHIVDIAEEVMKDLGIEPLIKPIRGGTDGSQLSFKGLPCPNIFAGGHNFHGRFEYIPVESMMKATEVIIGIAKKVAEKYA